MRFSRTDVLYRLRHSLRFVVFLCWVVGGGVGSGGVGLGGGGLGVGGWSWGVVGGVGGWVGVGKIKTWKIRNSENLKP